MENVFRPELGAGLEGLPELLGRCGATARAEVFGRVAHQPGERGQCRDHVLRIGTAPPRGSRCAKPHVPEASKSFHGLAIGSGRSAFSRVRNWGGRRRSLLSYEEEVEFLNPGKVGKKFRVTWKVVEEYEKRDKLYTVIEGLIVDEDGREILRRKTHGVIAKGQK